MLARSAEDADGNEAHIVPGWEGLMGIRGKGRLGVRGDVWNGDEGMMHILLRG